MSTTYIAMILATLIGIGLLLGIWAMSLLSGALNFLFVKPKIEIIQSAFGANGFCFIFKWDQDVQPVKFDQIRIHLFNPFGKPTEIDIVREFEGSEVDFVRDVDMGDEFGKILNAHPLEKAIVEIEVLAKRESHAHKISIPGTIFIKKIKSATKTLNDVLGEFVQIKEKSRFEIPERSFISPPLPKTKKQLKLRTNPLFAGEFAGGSLGGEAAPAVLNFSVSKVWIEPGCIVCDACEGIFPEVFEVTDSTCIIRPGAPLDDGLKIQESAEACPVEVIKFTKIG